MAQEQVSPPTLNERKSSADGGLMSKSKKLLGLGKKKQVGGGGGHGGDVDQQQQQQQQQHQQQQQLSEQATATETTSDHSAAPLVPSSTPPVVPSSAPSLMPSPPLSASPTGRQASPRSSPRMRPVGGASPNRHRIGRSSSPGMHSPSSSLIFERNVQEPEPSADVPAHIKTEDHIPPALDASSLAITDDHLNPDEVEIVMHSAHQPASSAVAGGLSDSLYSPSLVPEESTAGSHADGSEAAAGYGSLDMTDPRRLSFISFADVVQAEQVEHDRQEMLGSGDGLPFRSLSSTAIRSPSPMASAVSSLGPSASPPTSGTASPKTGEMNRTKAPASPTFTAAHGTQSPPLVSGELPLQIETMRQALRKTHSGDLSGARSQPLSPVSLTHDESGQDRVAVQ
ncbi:hypothetical protein IAQ61_003033 [Plenodomus lingam]|uniref:uncharacterized protein n=1 Tax=Leptosphaeria maculans TaxID=5022 RepID=UPI00332947AD|nr:hypothetical protein IAQ61_003033 [Plenodomus lingam]